MRNAGYRLLPAALLSLLSPQLGVGQQVPELLEMNVVLGPLSPYHVRVGIGQAKFLRFSCLGGPADVVISLSTYAEHADPLLFLSLNPEEPPSFQQHDASSFGQWREDAAGDHYVIAKAVSPRGGILGLVNMRHFAGQEMDGVLSIHCTFIVAFDTLFWDHLRSGAVCPFGSQPDSFCSGWGECDKHGICECDRDHTGGACEHNKRDIVVAAEGRYKFKVATSHYQYFRVRVPPRFPGGYLEVSVQSREPLVVLVRSDDLPTKGNFELSNFDDWVNRRNVSVLKFKVLSADGLPAVPGGAFQTNADKHGTPQLQRLGAAPRSLSGGDSSDIICPRVELPMDAPACLTPSFVQCQSSCMNCVGCVKGGKEDRCSTTCDACVSPGCLNALALCAGNASCMGRDAIKCEDRCSHCMSCFDRNDQHCSGCHCCKDCLPIAAKCSVMLEQPAEYNRFVFVGIFNHRRYYNDRENIDATATISLTEDPNFQRQELPSSWLADLYDPFRDIRTLEITQRQFYPDGEQYIYDVEVHGPELLRMEVRLFHDRMTLLHIHVSHHASTMELHFVWGPNITHVLSSSRAAPKTLFDFDGVHAQTQRRVTLTADDRPSLWVAIFGATDGFLSLTAKTYGDAPSAPLPPVGFALVCVFALLCGIMVLAVIYGGAQSLGERLGMDPSVPLSERFFSLVRPHNPHESTASLTRSGSLQGYVGSDVIDRSVEDQYLHRGGIGDDGI